MSTFRVIEGNIAKPKGFKATGIYSGIKKVEKHDLGILISEVPAYAAGAYTTNLFQAAPLVVTKESIGQQGKLQAIIVNSGNANACTGERGLDDARSMQQAVANAFSIAPEHVGVASTGVIGEYLPMSKVIQGIENLPASLSSESGPFFSQAILTTDLVEKTVCVELEIGGTLVTMAGTAKGSGMIHPNMATMLAFIATDAKVDQAFLQASLKKATDETFNMITVDGDTSTNDMVLVMANGLSGNEELSETHPEAEDFYQALCYCMRELAKKIARDGEGATKLLEVEVKGGPSKATASQVAKTVISSNLVKTAIYGADANWGRILCAVGYSGADISPDKIDVFLGDIQVVESSFPIPFSEEDAREYLLQENVKVVVDLHMGSEKATAWGCDLTYDYIRINASYRS
ncbi:bifunctional ornithine acetyltransferase/N-acetylglutamate synthase [Ammoniphilus sp. CFH 90114]|uniref:bifunctional ornithine acetyltransferase/N-acetylglutamate synthase n=1 Tax=Ammoniphilus sp. CFH 90114 TaxID=2493665 RepID=UPI00100E091B|nr:bifunctional ornithine acetyltransferase/N-acetylglutamate synthase [Ammoniphilus sp. CFH 90114]RXT15247.1 bifunctional ornithine acetyltransferase/N-acetylglutamate synthase [Ammoniphilus sp. CFH 90114]